MESRIAYIKAMRQARMSMGGLIRNADNPFTKSKYADLSAVLEVIDQPLLEQGLIVEQWPGMENDGFVGVDTTITHIDGHSEAHTITIPIAKKDAQGVGSAITYARRYALMSIFGLAPVDDDGNAAVGNKQVTAGEEWESIPAINPNPAPKLSENTRKRLHAVGTETYGKAWDKKRHELVIAVSKSQATSSNDLTEKEALALIAGMENKQSAA